MKGQVLVIDDNRIDLKVITTVIERSGYAGLGFDDHKLALEWLQSHVPQMIFLDLQMPQVTGFELIPIFRGMPALQKIPIVIVSGKNQSEDVKKAIGLGANDYVVKPIDPMVIQEKIEKMDSRYPSEFHSVDLMGAQVVPAYVSQSIEIVGLSEFGLRLISSVSFKPGDHLELTSLPETLFGGGVLLSRCLSCEKIADQKKFVVQTTFVGLKEPQRQLLRKSCRQFWIQNKREAS